MLTPNFRMRGAIKRLQNFHETESRAYASNTKLPRRVPLFSQADIRTSEKRISLKTANLLNFFENSKINVREKNCDFAAAHVFDCFRLFVILQFAR